jgi:hypothetical protein
MGKTTWEIIDLSEKLILLCIFLLIPLTLDRRSLYDVLTKAMKMVKLLKCILIVILIPKESQDIQTSLTRIDTTDAGREQINAETRFLMSIFRQDLSAQDVTNTRSKDIGILISVKVN